MKCHYDILDLPRDAKDDDIKKSYRKLALKWHPDKNPDKKEECTREFHLIQQAYEILIDPQERAWYDKHREAILRGGLGHGDTYEDKAVNVYQYFNTSCFNGYTDFDDGFYAVYRGVFETVAEEDDEYREDRDSECEPPGFGDSKSSYEEVVGPFYAYWESYCTAKSYVWEEPFDTRQAPNRAYRRAAEAENKKARDKAKKERNEEVRALVAFVKKRDKRVQAQKKMLEERAAEIAKRAKERKQKDRQKHLKSLENYKEADWSAMSEKDLESLEAVVLEQFGDPEDMSPADSDEEEEDLYEDLFCIACNKSFKTSKAFANHENSKKHRENVALLRAEMEEEEESDEVQNEEAEETTDCDVTRTEDQEGLSDPGEDDLLDEEAEDELIGVQSTPKPKLSKKQKKRRKQQQKLQNLLDQNTGEDLADDLEALHVDSSKQESAKIDAEDEPLHEAVPQPAASEVTTTLENNVSLESEEQPSEETIQDRLSPAETSATEVIDLPSDITKGSKNRSQKGNQQLSQSSTPQACNTCGLKFPTRNKLFQHIKTSGHALHMTTEATASSPAPDGKKSKSKKKSKR